MIEVKKLNRIKVVLAEKGKTGGHMKNRVAYA